eukprot:7489860-Ditylum_brightwellii.AAC.1
MDNALKSKLVTSVIGLLLLGECNIIFLLCLPTTMVDNAMMPEKIANNAVMHSNFLAVVAAHAIPSSPPYNAKSYNTEGGRDINLLPSIVVLVQYMGDSTCQ